MQCDRTLEIIRANEAELRALGIDAMALFGSVARGSALATSDVDLAIRLRVPDCEGGFAALERVDRIKRRVRELLGQRVDVVVEPVANRRLRSEIDRDRRVVF